MPRHKREAPASASSADDQGKRKQTPHPSEGSGKGKSRAGGGEEGGSSGPALGGAALAAGAGRSSESRASRSSNTQPNNAVVAVPLLETATAPAADLEPERAEGAEESSKIGQSLVRHKLRLEEAESAALGAAYKTTVENFAASQLRLLRADHLSSHRDGGVAATDANEDGAARIEEMQKLMLSWTGEPKRPSAFDLCTAHAKLVPGGGMLRTRAVRAGRTRFATPATEVQKRLEELVAALQTVSKREDLSGVAKAAWAGYNLLCLHPFTDGNGRLARALVNMMLARSGLPFVVSLAASESQRAAYRTGLVEAHRSRDLRPWARVVQTCVARGWSALEAAWEGKRGAAQEQAAGASVQAARREAVASGCMICLEEGPTCTLLCCGGAFHMRCLARWLHSSGTSCPHCRAPVPPQERPPPVAPPAPPPDAGPAVSALAAAVAAAAVNVFRNARGEEETGDDTSMMDSTTAEDSTTGIDQSTEQDDSTTTAVDESTAEQDDSTTTAVDESTTAVDESTTAVDEDDTTDANAAGTEEDDSTVVIEGTAVDEDDSTEVDPRAAAPSEEDDSTAVEANTALDEDDSTAMVAPGVDEDDTTDDTTVEG